MALDYQSLREAWAEAQVAAGAATPEADWQPMSMPVWWTWLCETAEQAVFWVEGGARPGQRLAESTWERQAFCAEAADALPPRQVFTMYVELGLPDSEFESTNPSATPTEQAKAAVGRAAAAVLDELIGAYLLEAESE